MVMRATRNWLVVVLVMMFGGSFASAGISINNLIVSMLDPSIDSVILEEDDDATYIIDRNGNGILDVGDDFGGMIVVQSLRRAFPPGATVPIGVTTPYNELTGEYLLRVTSVVGGPGAWQFTFGPNPAFESLYGAGAVMRLFDDPAQDVNFNAAGGNAGAIATATNGTLWALLGIDVSTPAVTFWQIQSKFNNITTMINQPTQGVGSAFANGAFSLNILPVGAEVEQLAIVTNYLGSDLTGTYALFGMDSNPLTPGLQRALTNFDLVSDADMSTIIAPEGFIPEPGTLSLLAAAGILAMRRKRA